MKHFLITLACMVAGLIIGAFITAHTIMVNAEISGSEGRYIVTIFDNDFIYE